MQIHLSGVAFHVHCVGLGFHVVIGVERLIVLFHHAYVIPSFLHVVVRLYLVIVNSNCSHNCCLLRVAKTGPFEVWSLHTPVGYSRPLSAVNDLSVTKQMNSRKSCLEQVSQLLVYQVALINQYLVSPW